MYDEYYLIAYSWLLGIHNAARSHSPCHAFPPVPVLRGGKYSLSTSMCSCDRIQPTMSVCRAMSQGSAGSPSPSSRASAVVLLHAPVTTHRWLKSPSRPAV